MRALGLRSVPRGFYWAVVEGTRERPIRVAHGRENAPKEFSEAERLSWVRTRFVEILSHHKPDRGGARLAEPAARGAGKKSAKERCRVEGVLMEACCSLGVPVSAGALKTISGRLGTASAKHYLEADEIRGLSWADLKKEEREAVLVATSTLE